MSRKLNIEDFIGVQYGYLTILSEHITSEITTKRLVNCKCVCGKETVKEFASLRRGMTKSCGCLVKEVHTKVGFTRRKLKINEGDKFGNLTVIKELDSIPRKVLCKCVCGVEKEFNLSNLLGGNTNSCGCLRHINSKEIGLKNRTVSLNPGEKFGRLTVIREVEGIIFGKNKKQRVQRQFECRCDCGNITVVQIRNLRGGKTKSCGCYSKDRKIEVSTKHNMHRTSEYKTWLGMKQRCYNKNTTRYDYYGGRGITVCKRWLESFENFYEDMGPKPGPDYSIDRIDNDLLIDGYSKGNCRWATKFEQVQNRRIMKKSPSPGKN